MTIRDYMAWAVRVAAAVLLFTAEPAINTFGKNPQARSWCAHDMVQADEYVAAPSEERRLMRAMCHRSSLIEPFRFAYDITGFPSAD